MEDIRHRSLYKYNENWGYQFRSNLKVRISCLEPNNVHDRSSYYVRTNELGGRTDNRVAKSGGERKKYEILFIGCSLAAGDGVSNQYRFSDLVERELPDSRSHNYALSGSGNDQQYLIHRDISRLVENNVLVLCPYIGDIVRNTKDGKLTYDPFIQRKVYRPKPYFEIENDELVLKNVPVPRIKILGERGNGSTAPKADHPGLKMLRKLKGGLKTAFRSITGDSGQESREPLWEYRLYDEPASREYILAFRLVTQLLKESGADYKIVMPLPNHNYYRLKWRANYLKLFGDAAEESGAYLLDILPSITELSQDDFARFLLSHGHYSEFGHRFIAKVLSGYLIKILR